MRGLTSVRLAAVLLAVSATGLTAERLQYRVLAGGQAVEGRLWLYAGGWGWLERVELARIDAGGLDAAAAPKTFPEQWRFAANNAYLVALETDGGRWYRSEMRVSPHEPPEAVITRSALSELLPGFVAELGSVQTLSGGQRTLVLPDQQERRITLLHEDGTPFAGERVEADVFVWRQNHCGVAVGLGYPILGRGALGIHRTDENGSFSVRAPDATIVLRREHIPVVASSESAVLRRRMDTVEIEPGGDVTIRSLWHPPPSTGPLRVRLLDPRGEPIAGWFAAWDMNTNTCGPPIRIAGPSRADGWIRFDTDAGVPAELTRELVIYDSDVREGGPWDRRLVHRLTQDELLRFARNGSITLRLEKPAQ